MTATNKSMTGAQLDELMAVAMRMQSDSEKMGERSVSMFAYAVQVAVLEIRETRCKYAELQSQNADLAVQLANAESKCRELAAENGGLKAAFSPKEIPSEAVDAFTDTVTIDHDCDEFGSWSYVDNENEVISAVLNALKPETTATDAFLAEVRASAIPEGYVLVPQEMHLSYEAMEGICFHCGDGGFAFGEFTDGLLFVGAIDDSDGQKIHGLHIATADYPEEGCATICEFLPVSHRGAAQ